MKAGASVFDPSGNWVGKIKSVTAKGAVLDTGKVKVAIPSPASQRQQGPRHRHDQSRGRSGGEEKPAKPSRSIRR